MYLQFERCEFNSNVELVVSQIDQFCDDLDAVELPPMLELHLLPLENDRVDVRRGQYLLDLQELCLLLL